MTYPSSLSDTEWDHLQCYLPPRLSKDYERMVQSSETFIKAAMIRLIVKRLARGA